ncbi:MAG: hypothetical protein NZ651_06205 [Candidatus Bipolaricaulota bacterium]|nr:hypothetical protein [Candidatus Bipolaricaulota bacterium]MDW8127346.1 hypothetical protein [Candidatus Bipolaricaulota bacterium]
MGEEENRGRRRTLVATKALFPGMPPARVPRFRALPPEKWSVNDFVSYLLAEMTARHITPTVPRNGMAAHLKRLLQAADAKFGPEGGRRALKQLIDVCLGRPGFSGTGYLLREAEAFWSGQFTGLYRAPKADVAEDW